MKRQPARIARRGFTLLEILLVLAILATITAITWPSVTRMFEDYELKEATGEVREQLAATKLHSLDAGVTWQFRFEPGGRRFLVAPYEREAVIDEDEAADSLATSPRYSGRLPQDLQFQAASESSIGSEYVPAELLFGMKDQKQLAETRWSPPQLFFSDGSAGELVFDIVDQRRHAIRLSVRGLTGAVTISSVFSLGNR